MSRIPYSRSGHFPESVNPKYSGNLNGPDDERGGKCCSSVAITSVSWILHLTFKSGREWQALLYTLTRFSQIHLRVSHFPVKFPVKNIIRNLVDLLTHFGRRCTRLRQVLRKTLRCFLPRNKRSGRRRMDGEWESFVSAVLQQTGIAISGAERRDAVCDLNRHPMPDMIHVLPVLASYTV